MFEELKRKYAHFVIRRKYLKKQNESLEFNKAVSNAKEFLIIMPESEIDFANSFEIIRYLQIHKKELTLFLSESSHKELPNEKDFKFISFHPDQISKFFLPRKSLLPRISNKKFDVVIDLNRNENTFFSAINCIASSGLKVGFRKNRSEEYYNLLFNSKQTEPLAAYSKFLEHLRMF